eukprot:scaffold4124_cov378-Prasinococcus_capsulatus_cf.AAC.2
MRGGAPRARAPPPASPNRPQTAPKRGEMGPNAGHKGAVLGRGAGVRARRPPSPRLRARALKRPPKSPLGGPWEGKTGPERRPRGAFGAPAGAPKAGGPGPG